MVRANEVYALAIHKLVEVAEALDHPPHSLLRPLRLPQVMALQRSQHHLQSFLAHFLVPWLLGLLHLRACPLLQQGYQPYCKHSKSLYHARKRHEIITCIMDRIAGVEATFVDNPSGIHARREASCPSPCLLCKQDSSLHVRSPQHWHPGSDYRDFL